MASIVLGLGASHTPMLALASSQWAHRSAIDIANPKLNLSDGRRVSYPQLLAEVGPIYTGVVTPEALQRKAEFCEAALDTLADALEAAAPDVVLIVGDDQLELFGPANQPAFAIFHGEHLTTYSGKYSGEATPPWLRDVSVGYLMDAAHSVPAAPALAWELIESLVDRGIDVTAIGRVDDPARAGFGHAYGFIVKRLFRGRRIPVLPVLLNTYFPPNVPSAARCHDIGRALRAAIEASASGARVAVVASGGLSHFVVDAELDLRVLDAIARGDADTLRGIPRAALQSGSSEILNWIMVAGALEGTPLAWRDYQPLYRTPAGTGAGAAFCIWRH